MLQYRTCHAGRTCIFLSHPRLCSHHTESYVWILDHVRPLKSCPSYHISGRSVPIHYIVRSSCIEYFVYATAAYRYGRKRVTLVKKHVTAGIVMLLPICLTMLILGALVDFLTRPFIGITEKMLIAANLRETPILGMSPDDVLFHASQATALILLAIAIFLIGCLGNHFFFRALIRFGNALLHKLPVVKSIYATLHDLISAMPPNNSPSFRHVVLVPFPNSQCYTIGLVSKENPIAPHLVSVFIPAAPNFVHGCILVFNRSEVISVDMSVEEAFRSIIFCGASSSLSSINSSNVITGKSVL
jgi:uncharacterized membrane protein